jgi:hypothetical protein
MKNDDTQTFKHVLLVIWCLYIQLQINNIILSYLLEAAENYLLRQTHILEGIQ